jgi:ribosomal protein S18 acetylase RimI-like enzyme
MDAMELRGELSDAGIRFFLAESGGNVVGVMGIQERSVPPKEGIVSDVVLIRHAYTRLEWQRRGIGSRLLAHLLSLPQREMPIRIGTWAANAVAIEFYEREVFRLIGPSDRKDQLLRTYWFSSRLEPRCAERR